MKSAPAYSISNRTNLNQNNTNPGVGEYNVDTKYHLPHAPAYSFRSRSDRPMTEGTPAPNTYRTESCPRSGSKAPAYSLGCRHSTGPISSTPGVGTYNVDNTNAIKKR